MLLQEIDKGKFLDFSHLSVFEMSLPTALSPSNVEQLQSFLWEQKKQNFSMEKASLCNSTTFL